MCIYSYGMQLTWKDILSFQVLISKMKGEKNMKITRLKLVNFIGIKHGTGRDEIEIVFENDDQDGKRIVMLTGGNGSGKTTILSQLHPFDESFDSRKSLIIEGTEGLKEIDIIKGADKYEIVHNYITKKKTSFIKKNGVEMNENGGVRTFREYIKSEFGLTPDYFEIGKIGSNTQNFIQQTTAQRKTYINKLLPDIGDYESKHKIAKEKFAVLESRLKTASNELSKIENEEAVRQNIIRLTDLITTLDGQIETSSNRVAVLGSEIESFTKILDGRTLADIINEKAEKTKQQTQLTTSVATFETKYGENDIDTMDKTIEDKDNLVVSITGELSALAAQRKSKNEEIVNLQNDIDKIKITLNGPDSVESVEELEKKFNKAKKEETTALKDIRSNPYAHILKSAATDINNQIYKFEQFKNFVIKYFSNLKATTFMATKTNVELFIEEDFQANLTAQEKVLRELVASSRLTIEEKKQTLHRKEGNVGKLDILSQRPEDCVIDTCPFIKDALAYKNLPKEIEALKADIKTEENELVKHEARAEKYVDLKTLFQTFNSLFEQMNPRNNLVYEAFVQEYGTIVNQIKGNLANLQKNSEDFLGEINKMYEDYNNFTSLKTTRENLEYKLNAVKGSSVLRESFKVDLDLKEGNLGTLKTQFEKISSDTQKKAEELENKKEVRNEYKTAVADMRSLRSIKTMLSTLKKDEETVIDLTTRISSNQKEKIELEKSLSGLRRTRVDSNEQLTKYNNDISQIESLKNTIEEVGKNHKNLGLLVEVLSHTKGIPLIFAQAYLEKTRDITNELLTLAYKDGFEVNFITNQDDFFIEIRAGENIKNDIKEASQGEVALTTISISLALIQQSMETFNILMLDEIDGPLDSSNRENFINILTKQIESMGVEQVFVISHNNAFDTEEMDLVMLKGSPIDKNNDEFMRNKRVIFDITEN